ncbi:HAD-IA family hydrolase [Kribbella sp. NPDC003557]|uniref:HAD family hydrolase n=1 Tax=Kribbella sp. NPDC003557 TaxID=3154449 RepID=UPI0033A467BF
MSERTYVRLQAGYRGRLGVEVGLFVAVDHLRRAGRLTPAEEARYLDVDDWFLANLPNPAFYADGNSIGAVTWFKDPIPPPMRELVDSLLEILDAHDVAWEQVTSGDPGTIVYEDEFQVGVVPYVRGEPTPLPDGTVLTPTSGGSKRAVAGSRIRHVLFDADGVLQDLPGGRYSALEPYVGDRARDFLHETWSDELPMLAGRGDYLPVLEAGLVKYGVSTPVAEVYDAVWKNIVLIEESLAVVRALKRNGYGVHLGTNQECYRGAHMRTALGYDDLFDVSCYSYDLGVAKPDPAFFTRAAERIGADAATILFIDDTPRNITGARTAGLHAEQWDFTQGHAALHALFSTHGVDARSTA